MRVADAERDTRKQIRTFRADPFQHGKRIFDQIQQKPGEKPTFSAKEALQHFTRTYADNERALGYGSFPDLNSVPEPSVHFPRAVPPFTLFANCLRKTRKSSSPGPNETSYSLEKVPASASITVATPTSRCLLQKSTSIPSCWRRAVTGPSCSISHKISKSDSSGGEHRLTNHRDRAATFAFPKRPSTTTIKHLLCAAVKRQRSTWQRSRDDLELHRSEHNLPIARGH